MHDFVSFNHQISPANQVKINGISAATFYGNGIFTTIAVYHSKPFLWEKHWQRLTKNAVQLGIDISDFSEESVKNALSEIIDYNKMTTGRARLTLFDESSRQRIEHDIHAAPARGIHYLIREIKRARIKDVFDSQLAQVRALLF